MNAAPLHFIVKDIFICARDTVCGCNPRYSPMAATEQRGGQEAEDENDDCKGRNAAENNNKNPLVDKSLWHDLTLFEEPPPAHPAIPRIITVSTWDISSDCGSSSSFDDDEDCSYSETTPSTNDGLFGLKFLADDSHHRHHNKGDHQKRLSKDLLEEFDKAATPEEPEKGQGKGTTQSKKNIRGPYPFRRWSEATIHDHYHYSNKENRSTDSTARSSTSNNNSSAVQATSQMLAWARRIAEVTTTRPHVEESYHPSMAEAEAEAHVDVGCSNGGGGGDHGHYYNSSLAHSTEETTTTNKHHYMYDDGSSYSSYQRHAWTTPTSLRNLALQHQQQHHHHKVSQQ